MLQLIGFFALAAICIGLSLLAMAMGYVGLGAYNLGGARNSWMKRLAVFCFIVFVGLCWAGLFQIAPFQISVLPPSV